ncbi:hypothetical protein [Anaerosacchariphilus polymeriproducens]|uniref:Uncharacterized protein n=1 Tax=Anaerosacchariphilus polymeriproducens TaxID=1812858 RepID=A0A371AT55_9FIRM|nr:hypothetical protein [Anaerosacchariphilus polymeriproducens]RDU22748.1 hypothetical protein DWV06_13345 [Anaerosacchariphilus polymeriproducens]
MNKEFEEFIALRCDKALVECSEYIVKERNCKTNKENLHIFAGILCYDKGVKDTLKFLDVKQKLHTFILKMRDNAIIEFEEHLKKEYKTGVDEDLLVASFEKTCYIKGIKDALKFLRLNLIL